MAWFNAKVKVTFIDDATGNSVGVTELPPNDLPETFELDTTLHIGADDWSVIHAEPKTRDRFAKTKSLTLRIRRLEKVDPRTILFSLPSICDFIPPLVDRPLSGGEFVIAEDDWRQFELVSHELAQEADEEIASIRRIHETAAAGVGWREIHIRKKLTSPLFAELSLLQLAESLNGRPKLEGVTYRQARSPIADSYSLTLADGLLLYGLAPDGRIGVLAISQYPQTSASEESIERLKTLARDFDLNLVSWCRCVRASPNDPAFRSLLSVT